MWAFFDWPHKRLWYVFKNKGQRSKHCWQSHKKNRLMAGFLCFFSFIGSAWRHRK